jgi:hypothetical protein
MKEYCPFYGPSKLVYELWIVSVLEGNVYNVGKGKANPIQAWRGP